MSDASRPVLSASTTGSLTILLSALFFSLLDACIKLIGPEYDFWDIAFYRFAVGTLIIFTIVSRHGNPFRGVDHPLLIIRGLSGVFSFVCIVSGIRQIPLSTAMVLFYSYPAFTAIISPMLFRERISRTDYYCIGIALVGVAVLFDFQMTGAYRGQLLVLLGAAVTGFNLSLAKKLRDRHSPIAIFLYIGILGSLATTPAFCLDPQLPANGRDLFLLSGLVASSVAAQLLLLKGLRHCKSWEGGILLMTEVVFVTAFGIYFLKETADWRFWLGTAMILGGIVALKLPASRNRSMTSIP